MGRFIAVPAIAEARELLDEGLAEL